MTTISSLHSSAANMDDKQAHSTSDVAMVTSVEEGSRGNGHQESSGAALKPVTLSYRASLEVDLKDGSKKLILDDACGTVAPGQVFRCIRLFHSPRESFHAHDAYDSMN